MPKFQFEEELENCSYCSGEGKTYWLGPLEPCLKMYVCNVCFGLGKRPPKPLNQAGPVKQESAS